MTYDDVRSRGGLTAPYDNGDTDSFVPVTNDMTVEGVSGEPIPFPEFRSFYHELVAEALGYTPERDLNAAVVTENRMATEWGLPLRSGNDHTFIVDPSIPFSRSVKVSGGPQLLPVPKIKIDPRHQPMMRPIVPLKKPATK